MTFVTIGKSVAAIEYGAFTYCTGLTSLKIPGSVSTIGAGAFQFCEGLVSVYIPASVTEIGVSAFEGCNGLTEIINYQKSPQKIALNVFGGLEKGKCTLFVPAGTVDAYRAADGWKSFLKTGVIGDSNVETFEPSGTAGELTWKLFSDGTLSVDGTGAMPDYFNSDDTSLSPPWSEYNEMITRAIIGDNIRRIGSNAFEWCTNLTSLTIIIRHCSGSVNRKRTITE